jgi:hypothetical protein
VLPLDLPEQLNHIGTTPIQITFRSMLCKELDQDVSRLTY